MADIKVTVISSVRPEPTSGGQLTLYRHLIGQYDVKVKVYGDEPQRLTASSAVRRLFGRLSRTRFNRLAEDFWILWRGRWLDTELPRNVARSGGIVLTVAHGDACMAALRFSQRYRLPLITFFHDWWPDIPSAHLFSRRYLERDFRRLYHESHAAFCVSEGMKAVLGDHVGAQILYPIPQTTDGSFRCEESRTRGAAMFKVLYCGNLSEYGAMLADVMKVLSEHKSIRLEVRGANPKWPADFRESMSALGLWRDFAPRDEFNKSLAEADAFLVPMAFSDRLRRRMETSFPSKLTELAQFGKPLVIWGPEYCSASKWARRGRRGMCVTDPNPNALRNALERLAASSEEQSRLSAAARHAAKTDFDPGRIQAQFLETLRAAPGS